MINYGGSVDSYAGEAAHDGGTGAASHGPEPISYADHVRVKEIHQLAKRNNRVTEMEANMVSNMKAAGIRDEKHLDALIAKRDGKDMTPKLPALEKVDPYELWENNPDLKDAYKLTTPGIALRCQNGAEVYRVGGYTIGDSDLEFHQTLGFCHTIGQCGLAETKRRKQDRADLEKSKEAASIAGLQNISNSIQKGALKPSKDAALETERKANETKTKMLKLVKSSENDANKNAEMKKCVNYTRDFFEEAVQVQKVSESDMAGLVKNLCLNHLVMPMHPQGITRYSARRNCDRAAKILENVGDAPTVGELSEYCGQIASGPEEPPADTPEFELRAYMSDSAKLEKEEREELRDGLQKPDSKDSKDSKNQDASLARSMTPELKSKMMPKGEVSDAQWDRAIKGVSENIHDSKKVTSSVNDIARTLVDAKAKNDQHVQKDETVLRYATDIMEGPQPTTEDLKEHKPAA
jgi:hypothetical protein